MGPNSTSCCYSVTATTSTNCCYSVTGATSVRDAGAASTASSASTSSHSCFHSSDAGSSLTVTSAAGTHTASPNQNVLPQMVPQFYSSEEVVENPLLKFGNTT